MGVLSKVFCLAAVSEAVVLVEKKDSKQRSSVARKNAGLASGGHRVMTIDKTHQGRPWWKRMPWDEGASVARKNGGLASGGHRVMTIDKTQEEEAMDAGAYDTDMDESPATLECAKCALDVCPACEGATPETASPECVACAVSSCESCPHSPQEEEAMAAGASDTDMDESPATLECAKCALDICPACEGATPETASPECVACAVSSCESCPHSPEEEEAMDAGAHDPANTMDDAAMGP